MTWWELLAEPWQFEFMQRALLVTMVAAVVCALLSCWLVLIGWSLLGDAVSHAVLPGVVLSYLVGVPFAVGALVFGVGSVALIGPRSKKAISTGLAGSVKSNTEIPPWYHACTITSRPGIGISEPLCATQFSVAVCGAGSL